MFLVLAGRSGTAPQRDPRAVVGTGCDPAGLGMLQGAVGAGAVRLSSGVSIGMSAGASIGAPVGTATRARCRPRSPSPSPSLPWQTR